MGVTSVDAQLITIGYGPAGSQAYLASGSGFVGAFGPNFIVTATDFLGNDLGSTATYLSFLGGGSPVDIWITETGLSLSPNPIDFVSGFTVNTMPPGGSIQENTYYDANNGLYGTGTKLASANFTTSPSAAGPYSTPETVPAFYSLTEEYIVDIPIGASPVVLATISLQSYPNSAQPTVPESSTWAMMGLGFAGLAFAGYRTSRKTALSPA